VVSLKGPLRAYAQADGGESLEKSLLRDIGRPAEFRAVYLSIT
jgi:hypothetical protein